MYFSENSPVRYWSMTIVASDSVGLSCDKSNFDTYEIFLAQGDSWKSKTKTRCKWKTYLIFVE